MTQTILVGIHDLVLSTRVNSVARSIGIPAINTFTPHDLLSKAHAEESFILVLDLNEDKLHPVESISTLKQDDHTRKISIVGFCTATDSDVAKEAKKAGCDVVIGESQFLESLEDILTGSLSRKN